MDPNYTLEWFKYADNDLLSAERNTTFHPVHIQLVCFLCQQSAEKYLKGYLIYKGIEEPPKIHNLDILCDQCSAFDPHFKELLDKCESLTSYGVQPRYPQEMEITESDMQKALDYARQVRDFAPLRETQKKLEENTH